MDAIRKADGVAIDYVCTGAVQAGDIVVIGDIAAIATIDCVTGQKVGLSVNGVFDFVSTGTGTAGDKAYWNGSAASTSSAGAGSGSWDGFLGYLVADFATGEKARVLYSPFGGATSATSPMSAKAAAPVNLGGGVVGGGIGLGGYAGGR